MPVKGKVPVDRRRESASRLKALGIFLVWQTTAPVLVWSRKRGVLTNDETTKPSLDEFQPAAKPNIRWFYEGMVAEINFLGMGDGGSLSPEDRERMMANTHLFLADSTTIALEDLVREGEATYQAVASPKP